MRMDVICDGKTIGRFDFQVHPAKGESIVTDTGSYVIEDLCHNFPSNRIQVLCNKVSEKREQRRTPQHATAQP